MAVSKINRQREETWTGLHKRLSFMPFELDKIFSTRVASFFEHSAKSLSTCVGYVFSCVIASTSYVVSTKASIAMPNGHVQNTNLFQLLVGPPSTGKSQALKHFAMDPIKTLVEERDLIDPVIQKSTVPGLTRKLAENNGGFLLSAEIFDSLTRLLKVDSDNTDSALLCELFSGERISFNYATKNSTNIESSVPFNILGCIQMFPMAKLFVLLNQGQGLLDRFLINVPLCLRPTPQESQESKRFLENLPSTVKFETIISAIYDVLLKVQTFSFSEDAKVHLEAMETDFIHEINEAIQRGTVPPKSKKVDMIARVSLCLHLLESVITQLLDSSPTIESPETEISMKALEGAISYVNYCESQKAIFAQFIEDITSSGLEEVRRQPSVEDIRGAVLLFPGRLVTLRSFRASGPRAMRKISESEFTAALEESKDFGKILKVKVPRSKSVTVFMKKPPAAVEEWKDVSEDSFKARYEKPTHSMITSPVRSAVIEIEKLPENFFELDG